MFQTTTTGRTVHVVWTGALRDLPPTGRTFDRAAHSAASANVRRSAETIRASVNGQTVLTRTYRIS